MKETISKVKRLPSEWERIIVKEKNGQIINLQNIQAAQYQKNEQHNQEEDIRPKQTFLQRSHTDG